MSLPYGPDPADELTIPVAAADRLAAVAAASPLAGRGRSGVLEHGRKALRARGVVGVVVADGATLEILPKIDGAGGTTGIRRQLVHMLGVSLNLRVEAGEIASHDEQRETMLEILIRLFSTRLADAVRRGMPRRYVAHEEDLSALRGRLDITRQFTTLAASPQRLACRYDALSPDIALNQIMKAAITRLRRIARASDNQRRLAELDFAYSDIGPVPAKMLRWDEVVIDRTNERWRALLDLARLLLGDRFQTTSAGETHGFSLLFSMSALFEEYVTRMLARALAGTGQHVVAQGGRRFCLETDAGDELFQTRPDILVKRGNVIEHIIDTKWKRIARHIDDPKQGVAQADIYQMMAYGRLYECPRITLLYPHHAELGELPLAVSHRIAISGYNDRLDFATVDVGTTTNLSARLRALCRT
jgi:5-methylcytosine-specific restriction enzyme subunit McrC